VGDSSVLASRSIPARIPAPTLKWSVWQMAYRSESSREKREKKEQFQTFNRPKVKVTRISASGKIYIDYKDTESLRKMVSGNGKILTRKRTGASAIEQRMLASAVKRARHMALLPYVTSSM
jgi:small subunit ribosomal protein S18